ncbi:MAG: MIP/aquaporin family protein [Actinomycetes bacterium]
MRKYLVEFIGTFFLVFTVTCAVLSGAPLAPLGIGAVLMVMVFAGGHISGGHFNPAVTLAVLLRGRITSAEAVPYWVTQLVAGVVAALLGKYVIDPKNQPPATELTGGHLIVAALLAELLFTFALAWVVLNVATSKDHPNNSFYGLAIGFTVLAGAVAVGGVSGGAFNPAVALGIMTAGISAWKNIWIFWLAELAGAALAAYAFKAANPDDA